MILDQVMNLDQVGPPHEYIPIPDATERSIFPDVPVSVFNDVQRNACQQAKRWSRIEFLA